MAKSRHMPTPSLDVHHLSVVGEPDSGSGHSKARVRRKGRSKAVEVDMIGWRHSSADDDRAAVLLQSLFRMRGGRHIPLQRPRMAQRISQAGLMTHGQFTVHSEPTPSHRAALVIFVYRGLPAGNIVGGMEGCPSGLVAGGCSTTPNNGFHRRGGALTS